MALNLKYDTPMLVPESLYNRLVDEFSGDIAHRSANGKFYVKILVTKQNKGIAACIRHGLGRNDTCICGSGKKFKKCCLNK